jgi:lysophospholipase L1-like esterase
MKRRLAPLIVLLVAIALAFAAGEITLRLLSRTWLRNLDVEMWRYARLVKTVSTVPGVVEEHRPNADAFLMGARVRTDEYGFRRPDPATEAKRRPGNRVVVALGDSLTFGWGTAEGQTYADQLERLLAGQCPRVGGRAATVYNAGIGNCNTSMELARYRADIRPRLKPEWVILGIFINDAEPDAVVTGNPFIWRSALAGLLSTRWKQQAEVRLRDYRTYYQGLYRDGQPGWERQKRAIHELGALLRADGIAATAILLPELHEPHRFGSFAGVYARLAEISRASGFEVIDPSASFSEGPGDAFWVTPEDAHPNPKAQALFAAALTRSRFACPR